MANEKIVKQWFVYASRDLRAAQALLNLGSEYKNIAAFNCQQCVEKSIKGYLVFNGIRPPKSHSIKDLTKLVATADKKLSAELLKAEVLTKYAVAYRYPDSEQSPLTMKQAQSALKIASRIYEKLRDQAGGKVEWS